MYEQRYAYRHAVGGKSTVGVVLAKITGRRFIDTDLLIQEKYGALLPDIIARMGTDGFIRAESGVLESLAAENAVIATGGSAVYGAAGMARLKDISVVAYLRVPAVGADRAIVRFRPPRGGDTGRRQCGKSLERARAAVRKVRRRRRGRDGHRGHRPPHSRFDRRPQVTGEGKTRCIGKSP